MPITAHKKWSARPLTKRADGWTANSEWTVLGATTQLEALGAPGIPSINTSHESSSTLKCDSVTADSPGFTVWDVKATYSVPKSGEHRDSGASALDEKPRLRWRFGNITENIGKDRIGKPILNSANSGFSTPLTKNFSALFLTVTQNEPFFNVAKAIEFRNKVNKTQFTIAGVGGVDVGQCMCLDIAPTEEYVNGAPYVRIAYEFEFRDGKFPFQPRALDQGSVGFYDEDGASAPLIGNFTDAEGNVLTSDVLLDGTGKPIDTSIKVGNGNTPVSTPNYYGGGVLDTEQSTATAKVFRFDVFDEIEMSSIFT